MPLELTDFDFILLMIIGYGFGVASGLCYCVKYRHAFLTRSKSLPSLCDNPVIASAPMPPSHAPVKLTIE